MRHRSLLPLALVAALSGASAWAAPPPPGYRGAAAYWPHHAAPVYVGGWYGYPRYSYPRYGYGLGYGIGFGYGYGTGWGLSMGLPWPGYGGWGWGAPLYPVYPYGSVVGTLQTPLVDEDLVYVQQPPAAASPPPPGGGHWYYCADPAGYFPYVQECNRPWVAVKPPPSATGR